MLQAALYRMQSMAADSILKQAEAKMAKVIDVVHTEFTGIRTGKASPDLVHHLTVDAYGSHVKLKEIAGITTPDPRTIMIQPWDGGLIDSIRKAIEESKLGITPMVDGKLIRLPIPAPSQERRDELITSIRKIAEEGRVSIRSNRRGALDDLKKAQKNKELTEDELTTHEKQVQKLTDQYIEKIDKLLTGKEADLMKI